MQQHIVDPSFGLNGKVGAVLCLLATIEPTFANFHEQAQMFDVSFRTGIFYEEGVEPQAWLAMYPTMVPRGRCIIVTLGTDVSGQLKVENWGDIEDFPERTAPNGDWREGNDPLFFKEVMHAVDSIQRIFAEYYQTMNFTPYTPTRYALVD